MIGDERDAFGLGLLFERDIADEVAVPAEVSRFLRRLDEQAEVLGIGVNDGGPATGGAEELVDGVAEDGEVGVIAEGLEVDSVCVFADGLDALRLRPADFACANAGLVCFDAEVAQERRGEDASEDDEAPGPVVVDHGIAEFERHVLGPVWVERIRDFIAQGATRRRDPRK